MGFVLHMLQQHQAQGHIADAVKAHEIDCPRHRINGAALPKLRTIDHTQQLVVNTFGF